MRSIRGKLKNLQEKARFLHGIFSAFQGSEAPNFPFPTFQAIAVYSSQPISIARCGSRAVTALARVWVAPSEARLRTSNACIAVRNPRPSATLDAGRIRGGPSVPLAGYLLRSYFTLDKSCFRLDLVKEADQSKTPGAFDSLGRLSCAIRDSNPGHPD